LAAISTDILATSVQSASYAERALGARAAQACLDLRTWVQEIESWHWPGTFDVPRTRDQAKQGRSSQDNAGPSLTEDASEEIWGSLPAQLVRDYEARADEISRQLDEIDVEELKEYVLVSHYRAGSRPSSSMNEFGGPGPITDLKRLDDYTAVVTAIILQALPYLSRLGRLLDLWTVRLIILRSAPGFVRDLRRARVSLDQGWAKIAMSPGSVQTTNGATFERSMMLEMRYVIEQQVSSLGRRLDRFLDDLEGRDDTVPDSWIDDFELLESAYSAWVVQAERKVQEMEWREQKAQSGLAAILEIESPITANKAEIGVATTTTRTVELGDQPVTTTSPTDPAQEATRSFSGPLNSNPPEPGLDGGEARKSDSLARHSISIIPPQDSSETVQRSASDLDKSSSTFRLDNGLSRRSSERSSSTPTLSAAARLDIPEQSVRKRAAFLNGIERTNSLNQSKSPVRPFEHASNAFTRLFKKEAAAKVVRPIRRPLAVRSASEGNEENDASPGSTTTISPVADVANKFNAMYLENLNATIGSQRTPKDELGNPLSRSVSNRSTSLSRDNSPAPQIADKPQANAIGIAVAEPVFSPQTLTDLTSAAYPSPAKEDFPSNWPLAAEQSSEPRTVPAVSQQEPNTGLPHEHASTNLRISRVPMPTDAFDRVIIQDMPDDMMREVESPGLVMEDMPPDEHQLFVPVSEQAISTPEASKPDEDESLWHTTPVRPPSRTRTNSGNSVRSTVSSSRRSTRREQSDQTDDVESAIQRKSTSTLAASAISPPQPAPRPVSTVVEDDAEDDAEDESDNGPPSPVEIVDVQRLSYFNVSPSKKAQSVRSPSVEPINSAQRSSSDTAIPPQLGRLEVPNAQDFSNIAGSDANDHALVKRASVASIEAFSGAAIRSVDVPKLLRRSSTATSSPFTSPPATPVLPRSPLDQTGARPFFTSQTPEDVESSVPSLSKLDAAGPSPLSESDSREVDDDATTGVTSPAQDEEQSPTFSKHMAGPLNAVMTKRQAKAIIPDENVRSVVITPHPPKHASSTTHGEDSFDRHVSEVLERLPSGIKFKPRPGAETPVSRSNEARMFPASRRGARTPSRASTMTIAPAEQSPKKPSSATEPIVKLYHLTQAGREEPIKLYVRLVGENERVMVRVGGGWADLAEYLRQYADHHGSRTVSDGNAIEVLQTVNGAPGQRKLSGSTARNPYSPSPINTPNRPTSKDGPSKGLNNIPAGSDAFSDDLAAMSPPAATHITPLRNAVTTAFITPRGSRPSTANDAHHAAVTAATNRPSSRLSNADSPGVLYGSGRKSEISSEHKAKWVEGMLERAKRAGGGGGGVSERSPAQLQDDDASVAAGTSAGKYFGELGKAGTTRRVIFRSASASSGSVPSSTIAAAQAAAVAAIGGTSEKK
jgi:hypothetical protein